jgi:hypothetical protein
MSAVKRSGGAGFQRLTYAFTSNLARARLSDIGRIVPHTARVANGRSNFPKHQRMFE